MELLAPAGNLEKLKTAYDFGADAAYIGIKNFSLRAKADNFHEKEYEIIRKIKGDKKLYGALNIFFHNQDLKRLEQEIAYFKEYPFDAFIISDIGLLPLLRRHYPDMELHLSTQANCVNYEAARIYQDMGFSRIIPGREVNLDSLAEIKAKVPGLEIEAFVHGAMCLAYSGRCFLSSYMSDRSANQGDCAHSCRWNYRFLEEQKRPGEYYPVIEGDGFTTIMSSKDLCMIDHLKELKEAGVDSLKIEGRMKSIYYAAVITRTYRKNLDALEGMEVKDLEGYRLELDKVSHRPFTTGFFFNNQDVSKSTTGNYLREFAFLGTIGKETDEKGVFELNVKNQIKDNDLIEYIGPDMLYCEDKNFIIYDEHGVPAVKADHNKVYTIRPGVPVKEGYILRRENPESLKEQGPVHKR